MNQMQPTQNQSRRGMMIVVITIGVGLLLIAGTGVGYFIWADQKKQRQFSEEAKHAAEANELYTRALQEDAKLKEMVSKRFDQVVTTDPSMVALRSKMVRAMIDHISKQTTATEYDARDSGLAKEQAEAVRTTLIRIQMDDPACRKQQDLVIDLIQKYNGYLNSYPNWNLPRFDRIGFAKDK